MWIQRPVDTSAVRLPAELEALTERLAENAHEIWARQRLAEGWTHGPERNDAARRHPDLVPYADLLESEKEYDPQTASFYAARSLNQSSLPRSPATCLSSSPRSSNWPSTSRPPRPSA
jgi:hypothetical protein